MEAIYKLGSMTGSYYNVKYLESTNRYMSSYSKNSYYDCIQLLEFAVVMVMETGNVEF